MAVQRDYREFMLDVCPPVLRGYWGRRYMAAIALPLADQLVEACRLAMTASWLRRNVPVAEDALVALADQRNIDRYPLDSQAEFRSRVDSAWALWTGSGGPEPIISHLAAAGFPGAQIFYSWSPGLPVESPPDWWSQFWVFFPYGTHAVTAGSPAWGSFVWGDGTVYGLEGLTVPQIRMIRSIIRKWKRGQYICRNVLFELSSGGASAPPYDVAMLTVDTPPQ
jgi:hypothetical protein